MSAGGGPNPLLKIEPNHPVRAGSAHMTPPYNRKARGGPSDYAGLGGGFCMSYTVGVTGRPQPGRVRTRLCMH